MRTQFENQFGKIAFRIVSDVMHVKTIRGADIDARFKFGIETAEKVALITENRRVQVCAGADWHCYVVLHESESFCAVAEIESLTYTGSNPSAEIQSARRDAHL